MKKYKKIYEYDFYPKKNNKIKLLLLILLILFTILLAVINLNIYIRNQHIVYKTSREFIKNLNQINYLQIHYRENKDNKKEVNKILSEFDISVKKAVNNLRTFEKLLDKTITYYPIVE